MFQFPLHRDPRCNFLLLPGLPASCPGFQFPLHRDPRCNATHKWASLDGSCFSSLYIGILAATPYILLLRTHPLRARFSSLYIGILAATLGVLFVSPCQHMFQFPLHRDPRCNLMCELVPGFLKVFQFPLHRDPRCNTEVGPKRRIR